MADRRRRPLLVGLGAALAIVVVAGLAAFQPWKLVLNTTVEEAAPQGATSLTPAGRFQSYEHETVGSAQVVALDGRRFVRLEDFSTSNGPDVVVYLSPAPAAGPGGFGEDAIDLGSLKGNRGAQNYEIPAGTDLDRYRSVVIWCRRFRVPFGAAPIS